MTNNEWQQPRDHVVVGLGTWDLMWTNPYYCILDTPKTRAENWHAFET